MTEGERQLEIKRIREEFQITDEEVLKMGLLLEEVPSKIDVIRLWAIEHNGCSIARVSALVKLAQMEL